MQERTNSDLYLLIKSLSGVFDFASGEPSKIQAFANRRFYEAYQATPMWPRYLVSAELRTIKNQIVPFSEDSFYVFGAGTSGANGLYVRNSTQASVAAYTKYDTDNTTALYSLIYVSGTSGEADAQFTIISGAPSSGGAVQYTNADDWTVTNNAIITTVESGWVVNNGTTPAPIVRDVSIIGEFLRVHRKEPFFNNSSLEFDFFVQFDGAHVLNVTGDDDNDIYITYKKQLAANPITDIEGSESEVPEEFFYYIAHAAYADFLRMDGQHDKAVLEEQTAQIYLANELEKTDQIMNNNTVKKRFHTYISTQSR